jgi:putative peptidoglycan lipid II flippase
MIGRIFSQQSKSITGAAVLLGVAAFASRLVGLIRDHLLANMFGAGHVLDAYYAAFRIPDFIFNIVIIGALSAAMIPLFAKAAARSNEAVWELANVLLGIVGLVTIILSVLSFIAAPFVMRLIVPGFSPSDLALAVTLTRIMSMSPVILGMSSIIGSILQTNKNFLIFSLAPVMYNTGIIVGALAFVPFFGVRGLAVGVLLGTLLHLGIQLPPVLSRGFRFAPTVNWHHPAIRSLGFVMVPRIIDLAVGEINFMIITAFASTLGTGRITMFQYANNLQGFPISLIGISFAVASFPTLATLAASKDWQAMRERLSATTTQILFFMVPLTVLFLFIRAQIVRVVYGSGAFDWTATPLKIIWVNGCPPERRVRAPVPLKVTVEAPLTNTPPRLVNDPPIVTVLVSVREPPDLLMATL